MEKKIVRKKRKNNFFQINFLGKGDAGREDITSLFGRLTLATGGLLDDVVQYHHVCAKKKNKIRQVGLNGLRDYSLIN